MTAKPSHVSIAQVRRCLVGTCMPADPSIPVIPKISSRWPKKFLEKAAAGLKPAGVLIPLIDRASGLSVLLTQRSSALRLHAGQVSFPGGRMEHSDVNISVTALRETHEEVGISPEAVEIAGYLDPLPTVTGYAVTPVVGVIAATVNIVIDPGEVEAAFEVPLDFLMEERNQAHSTREIEGIRLPIVEFNFAGRRIWGATATMLLQLRERILKQ